MTNVSSEVEQKLDDINGYLHNLMHVGDIENHLNRLVHLQAETLEAIYSLERRIGRIERS